MCGHQKNHRDVFLLEKPDVLLKVVGLAPIQDQNRPLIERAKQSPESFSRRLDIWDEDVDKPLTKDVTGDEACLGRVQLEALGVISTLKKQRIDCLCLGNDSWCEPCAIQSDACDGCASPRRSVNSNMHSTVFGLIVFGEKDVDTLSVRVSLSPHLVQLKMSDGWAPSTASGSLSMKKRGSFALSTSALASSVGIPETYA